MFLIEFTDEPVEYPYEDTSVPAAPGRLVLGTSREGFLANLSLWSKSAYKSHWANELKSAVEGKLKAALVVSYNDPTAALHIEIWRVYRDGELAHFQNQLFWCSALPNGFDVLKMSQYIQDREVITEEGNRIS